MPVITEYAKKRLYVEGRISRFFRKIRKILDLACYWLFNVCAFAALIRCLLSLIGVLPMK